MVLLQACPPTGSRETATKGNRALGQGVDTPVGTLEGRHQKGSSGERLGVPHGGDRHIQAAARPGEGRQIGGYHHRGGVAHANRRRRDDDTHTFEGVGQRLDRELGLSSVSRASETHDQAVADELIIPDTADVHDIPEPHQSAALID